MIPLEDRAGTPSWRSDCCGFPRLMAGERVSRSRQRPFSRSDKHTKQHSTNSNSSNSFYAMRREERFSVLVDHHPSPGFKGWSSPSCHLTDRISRNSSPDLTGSAVAREGQEIGRKQPQFAAPAACAWGTAGERHLRHRTRACPNKASACPSERWMSSSCRRRHLGSGRLPSVRPF